MTDRPFHVNIPTDSADQRLLSMLDGRYADRAYLHTVMGPVVSDGVFHLAWVQSVDTHLQGRCLCGWATAALSDHLLGMKAIAFRHTFSGEDAQVPNILVATSEMGPW